jgi:hypothetical protein
MMLQNKRLLYKLVSRSVALLEVVATYVAPPALRPRQRKPLPVSAASGSTARRSQDHGTAFGRTPFEPEQRAHQRNACPNQHDTTRFRHRIGGADAGFR